MIHPRAPTALALALVAWLGTVLPGAAQPAPVRFSAGEHAAFTRVVAQTRDRLNWTLARDGQRLTLRPVGPAGPLSLQGLFDLIPRTRLADARLADGAVVLELACDCPVESFYHRPGIFVLDITDAVAVAPRAPEPAAPPAAQPPDTDAIAQRAGQSLATALRPTQPTGQDDASMTALAQGVGEMVAFAIGGGITRGILERAPDRTLGRAHDAARTGGGDQPMLLPELAGIDAPSHAMIAIRDPSAPPPTLPGDPPVCTDNALLEPLGTPSDVPAARRLAAVSETLYGEFDTLARPVLQQSVLTLLSLGLGDEARLALSLAGPDEPLPGVLQAVADLVADVPGNALITLADSIDCRGPLGVLALIAAPPVTRSADWHMRRALSFSQFPAELRFVLAERLFTRHIEGGALDAARVVLDSMIRSGFFAAGQLAAFDARLEAARGEQALAALRAEDAPWTTAAELLAILSLNPEAATDHASALSAEALATAERMTRDGRTLMAAVIARHSGAGRFDDALSALDRLATWPVLAPGDAADVRDLRGQVWMDAIRTLPAAEFLQLLLLRTDWRDPDLPAATRQALGERLSTLGLDALPALQPTDAMTSQEQVAVEPSATDTDTNQGLAPAVPSTGLAQDTTGLGSDTLTATTREAPRSLAATSGTATPAPSADTAFAPAPTTGAAIADAGTRPDAAPAASDAPAETPADTPVVASENLQVSPPPDRPIAELAPPAQPATTAALAATAAPVPGDATDARVQAEAATNPQPAVIPTPAPLAGDLSGERGGALPVPGDAMREGQRVLSDSARLRESLRALLDG